MAKVHCINHEKAAAAVMCHQCHKPLCTSCVVVMPHGEFCSTQCSALNKSVKTHLKGFVDRKPRATVLLVGAFLVLIGLSVLFHLLVASLDKDSDTRKNLGKFDLWEQLLSTSKEKGEELKEKKKP